MTNPPGFHRAPTGAGTSGTKIRDSRVAALLVGLALAACGGESETAGSDDSNTANSSGGTSGADTSSATHTSSGNSVGSGGVGPTVTSTTSSTVGAGGNSNASTDATSGSSSSSGGLGGEGGSAGAACEPQDGSGCLDDCAVQDITLLGGCEPASVFVFNGVECVAMDGCSCVGDDCNASYASAEACAAAHAPCADRQRSCDEIATLYSEYVSHTACQDDSDCRVVTGRCEVGFGGCHHEVNRRWGQADLDAIIETWTEAGCSQGVCPCALPPAAAICDNGVCVPSE